MNEQVWQGGVWQSTAHSAAVARVQAALLAWVGTRRSVRTERHVVRSREIGNDAANGGLSAFVTCLSTSLYLSINAYSIRILHEQYGNGEFEFPFFDNLEYDEFESLVLLLLHLTYFKVLENLFFLRYS